MLDRLLTANLTLLLAHQIDAAWWREWEMFALPGGIQLFVFLNTLIVYPLLHGYARIRARGPGWVGWSYALAALVGCVLPIHAGFALAGLSQFHLPLSIALIVACGAGALAQALLTRRLAAAGAPPGAVAA